MEMSFVVFSVIEVNLYNLIITEDFQICLDMASWSISERKSKLPLWVSPGDNAFGKIINIARLYLIQFSSGSINQIGLICMARSQHIPDLNSFAWLNITCLEM